MENNAKSGDFQRFFQIKETIRQHEERQLMKRWERTQETRELLRLFDMAKASNN